jgi:hypothetical protein
MVIRAAFPAGITCADAPGVTTSDYLDQNAQNAPRRVSRSLLPECKSFPHGLLEFCTMAFGGKGRSDKDSKTHRFRKNRQISSTVVDPPEIVSFLLRRCWQYARTDSASAKQFGPGRFMAIPRRASERTTSADTPNKAANCSAVTVCILEPFKNNTV